MPHHSPPTSDSTESTSSAVVARLITALLIALVVLMVGRIYWRWESVREPSTAVLICGDGSLEGARIQVDGEHHHYAVALDSDNGWQTPILLDPGFYRLIVTHRGQIIRDEQFSVDRTRGRRIDLPSMVIIVGASQLADDRFDIFRDPAPESSFTPIEIQLMAKDRYRTAIYLYPGNYHVIARSAVKQSLFRADFTVDRTMPVRVDLIGAANENAGM